MILLEEGKPVMKPCRKDDMVDTGDCLLQQVRLVAELSRQKLTVPLLNSISPELISLAAAVRVWSCWISPTMLALRGTRVWKGDCSFVSRWE